MGKMNQMFACTLCSLSCFPASSINFHKQIQLLLVIRVFSSFRKDIFVRIPPSDEYCVCVHGATGAGWKMLLRCWYLVADSEMGILERSMLGVGFAGGSVVKNPPTNA